MVLAGPVRAADFDYFILALSWQPNWCAAEGDARNAPECRRAQGQARGFTLHGLWPQHEAGWPEWCRTVQRDPTRAETAAMGGVMAPGLAWHQWQKHGRCAGLSAVGYLALMRQALARVTLPEVFARIDRPLRLPASVVEEAFLEANPGLHPDGITITCRDGMIREARICLTKDLGFRRCGDDVIRDCRLPDALMQGLRRSRVDGSQADFDAGPTRN